MRFLKQQILSHIWPQQKTLLKLNKCRIVLIQHIISWTFSAIRVIFLYGWTILRLLFWPVYIFHFWLFWTRLFILVITQTLILSLSWCLSFWPVTSVCQSPSILMENGIALQDCTANGNWWWVSFSTLVILLLEYWTKFTSACGYPGYVFSSAPDFNLLFMYQRAFTSNAFNQKPLPFRCALLQEDVDAAFPRRGSAGAAGQYVMCCTVSAPGGSRGRGCRPGCLPSTCVAAWAMCIPFPDPVQWDNKSSFVIRENWDRIDANNDDVGYMAALATSSADMICTIFGTDSSKAWIAKWKPMFKFICHQILCNSTVIYMYFLNLCKQFVFAVGQNILRDRGTTCSKFWARVSDTGCRTELK